MKQRDIITLALFAGLLSACTVQDIPMPDHDGLYTFHAESGDALNTKTTLQSGTLVNWCPQDEIHVFYGNASGRFISTNTSVSATADFKGELPGLQRNDNDAFWAVYPYAQEQSLDGNAITLSLPATQAAVEGTFDDDLFISMARSTNTDLRFYNVCGGIKFSVGIDGVKKVVFRGKNNEPLAGKVKVGFDNNLPKVTTVLEAEQSITVNAPDGGTFTPGAWYYLVSFPASLSKGYVLALYGDSLIDTKEGEASVEILRSVWGVISDVGGDSSGDDFTGLSIEAIEDGTITISNPLELTIEYSKDARVWTSSNSNPIEISIAAEEIVRLRGDNLTYAEINNITQKRTNIKFSSDCYVYGNVMSLVNSSDYENVKELTNSYTFCDLFSGNTHFLNHPTKDLFLPATTLTEGCYVRMFKNCDNLTRAPELPAITMADGCYFRMFDGCSSLTKTPELPATTMAANCYNMMFMGCSSLTKAPELPATTLAEACYNSMFMGCSSLTKAPELPAIIMADYCYNSMFYLCTSLTDAPVLPAIDLAKGCYLGLFGHCTSLTTAPDLPAINLVDYCYHGMFEGCTSLTTAPDLPATHLVNNCYGRMFSRCSNLNYIKALFTTTPGVDFTENWVEGVAPTGTFVKNPEATWDVIGVNGVPEGWAIDAGETKEFTGLSIEAIEDGTITISNPFGLLIEYSKDARNWKASNANPIEITVTSGEIVCLRGNNQAYARFTLLDNVYQIHSTNIHFDSNFYVYGNIMSLVDADSFETNTELIEDYTFSDLLAYNEHLINHPSKELVLPATSLSAYCYAGMFSYCSSLSSAPALPATALAGACYRGMFSYCSSLSSAPALPATALAEACYMDMFKECSNLRVAPELPATVIAASCYEQMFYNCSNLRKSPFLAATTLAERCYSRMFSGCTNLIDVQDLAATTLAENCCNHMFSSCTSMTTAPKLPATTLSNNCYLGMFFKCTSLVNAPDLPALILANNCYEGMFADCTNLMTAPELPATSLVEGCYSLMFKGCEKLTKAPRLQATMLVKECYDDMFHGCSKLSLIEASFTMTPGPGYTSKWLYDVAASGTFVKNPDATWDVIGPNGVPEGWTVVYAE